MKPAIRLKHTLAALDGRDYTHYQTLLGGYAFERFRLIVQQVPKDPFAPPHAASIASRSDGTMCPLLAWKATPPWDGPPLPISWPGDLWMPAVVSPRDGVEPDAAA